MADWSEDTGGGFDWKIFSSGVHKRVSIILLLDTSQSMQAEEGGRSRIAELNEALRKWAEDIKASPRLRHRAEIAVITFGNQGVQLHLQAVPGTDEKAAFCPAALFTPAPLAANGVTPMLEAVRRAVSLAEQRKGELDRAGVTRLRPLVFMVTDGAPTDPEGHPQLDEGTWGPLARELRDLEERKKLAFFAVGVTGACLPVLEGLAPEGYWDLGKGDLMEFLQLVSASAADSNPIAFARDHLRRLQSQA